MTSNLMSLPQDITWNRLAFSPDMFDTKLDPSGKLPRKWMTSLSAFYYVVPEEETKKLYPDRRLVYLKVVSSITGVNLIGNKAVITTETWKEDRTNIEKHLGKFQTSTLDLIITGLRPYWPCSGAILQAAVYPHPTDGSVSLWDYPYIQDFEPKKREMYETVSRTGEVLSGSKSSLNLKKGLSTSETLEESDLLTGVSVKAGGWGVTAETSVSGKWGTEKTSEKEKSEVSTTDSSRNRRETQSFTTSINQMYQPLLAYHLGTNRALWIISPRPHTVDSENSLIQVYPRDTKTKEGALIGRKLEGIQDMFLVVNMPKTAAGLCFQGTLDTGYELETFWKNRVIVLRRNIQSCAKLKGDQLEVDTSVPRAQQRGGLVVSESPVAQSRVKLKDSDVLDDDIKRKLVFNANNRMQTIVQRMVDGVSSGLEEPKPFIETETFHELARSSLVDSTYTMDGLREDDIISAEEFAQLQERGLSTVGALMQIEDADRDELLSDVRTRIVHSAGEIGVRLRQFYDGQDRDPDRA